MSHDARLSALGIELPRPIANFVPFRRRGDLIFLAGQTCAWNGAMLWRGEVPLEHDLDAGRKAACVCGLNLIAALPEALGGLLDGVEAGPRLGGFVTAAPDFPLAPKGIDGAADLMAEIFGPEIGAHARTAVGVATLPQNATVAVDAVFAVRRHGAAASFGRRSGQGARRRRDQPSGPAFRGGAGDDLPRPTLEGAVTDLATLIFVWGLAALANATPLIFVTLGETLGGASLQPPSGGVLRSLGRPTQHASEQA